MRGFKISDFRPHLIRVCLAVLAVETCLGQVPQISEPLTPSVATPEGAGLTLTVNGAGFTPYSVLYWNGSPRLTTVQSSTKLTATITAADLDTAGTAAVTVANPGTTCGGATCPTSNVAYLSITNPAPVSLSVSQTIGKYAVGSQPLGVAVGDFNHDGNLDLATSNYGDNTVSVLLGNGDGSFQPAVNYSAPTSGYMVGVGDFNGDGNLDIAVTYAGALGGVSILLGNGDGTFKPAATYRAGRNPATLGAIGDFNGDGNLDLAIANNAGGDISILLGNGDGTFQAPVDYAAGAAPSAVTVGDFNGDGKLDIADVNTLGNSVSVILGNGDGTFQPAVNYLVGGYPIRIEAADFNGDGKLDLAVINQSENTASVLLGNGDGTFLPQVKYSTGLQPWGFTLADLNGDGKIDLVIANNSNDEVSVLLGNGDGSFQPPNTFAAGPGAFDVAAGDFNGDGKMDLAAIDATSNQVSILMQPAPPFGGYAQLAGGNVFSGNQTISGTVTATWFAGNGAGLSNVIAAGLNCTGCVTNSLVSLPYALGDQQGGNAVNALMLGGLPPSSYATTAANSFTGKQTMPSLSVSGTMTIGGGTAIVEYVSVTQSITLPALSSGTCNTFTTSAISGFTPGTSDTISLGLPTALVSNLGTGIFLVYQAWETNLNPSPSITIQVCNPTTARYRGGNTGTVRVDVLKH